ncbi:PGAP1-like protein [Actinocrispum wychmicini]|uniref:PGAP1-like protein n=2 Tax=Actinocrispum wychmicini TaxID=1213861 RepID=A0A4R2IVP1_9PSEU|nr:PGAP1-like protein [Actinocrispum wychmicini]
MTVVGSVVAVFLASLGIQRLFDQSAVADRSDLGPVLLIPGYGGNQASLSVLADRIRQSGRPAMVIALPGDGTGDLQEQVAVLRQTVDDAYSQGATSVDLIGYSAGGVVARLWAERYGKQARRIITLGSPMHGTQVATAGNTLAPDACPVACQQLAVGSSVLRPLADKPVTVPWMSIWTEQDQTVVPPDSARLDGAVNVPLQSVCPGVRVSHSELPTNHVVTSFVIQAISLQDLTVPTSTDC